MRQHQRRLTIPTPGRALVDVTAQVAAVLSDAHMHLGTASLFLRHTSASLVVQENADPAVLRDLLRYFARLVPDGDPLFEHTDEGPDDMSAHVRSALTATSIVVPFEGGRLLLGTWQAIYVFEHRTSPHRRELVVHLCGD